MSILFDFKHASKIVLKRFVHVFCYCLLSFSLVGQTVLDSLKLSYAEQKDDSSKVAALLAIGDHFMYQNLDSTLLYYKQALAIAEVNQERATQKQLPTVCYYMGATYASWGYVKEALEYGHKAADLYQKYGMEEALSDAYMLIGTLEGQTGKPEEGADLLHQSIEIKKRLKAYKKLGHAYMNLTLLYRDLGKLNEGVELIDSAIARFKAQKFELGVKRAYQIKGEILKFAGENDKALVVYQEALELYQQQAQKDPKGEVVLINSIAGLYKMLKEYDRALDYYNDGLAILETADLKELKGLINHNIGGVYKEQEDYDQALVFYKKGLVFYETIQHPTGLSRSYRGLGSVYHMLEDYEEAIFYYQKATETLASKKNLDYGDVAKSLARLNFDLYKKLKVEQPNKAKEHLEQAEFYVTEALLCPAANLEAQLSRYRIGKEVYEVSGDASKALNCASEIIVLADSMFEQNKIDAVLELETQYQTEKKELEIENLNQDKALQLAENRQQQILLYGVGGALSIVLLLLLLLSRLFAQKQKANRDLEEKNNLISKQKENLDKQNSEKELLLKEIHHRVKNNLQIISSLLDLQSNQIEDEAALSAIEDGQSRVKSMALIHHKLYQNEDIATINFKEYVEQLSTQILSVLTHSKPNIQIDIDPKLDFDIDTAIPLGLILNELLTNACKYAFDNRTDGQLKVVLKQQEAGQYQLEVKDDGVGMPEHFELRKAKSLGLRLVRRLSKQLFGKARYQNNNGAHFIITFKDTLSRKNIA